MGMSSSERVKDNKGIRPNYTCSKHSREYLINLRNVSRGGLMAAALVEASVDNIPPDIKDISAILYNYCKQGFPGTEKLALRKIPGGFYSEDADTWLNILLHSGYVLRNPDRGYIITDKTHEIIRGMLCSACK